MLDTDASRTPILITGGPRSGTTFCGKIISASPDVFEVYEPFNHQFHYNLGLPQKFFRLTDSNDAPYKPNVDGLVQLSHFGSRIGKLPRAVVEYPAHRNRGKSGEVSALLALKKLIQEPVNFWPAQRVSLKDPIAFFSSDWIARQYGAKVIILVRHPGGVVSSFLKLGWEPETRFLVDHQLPVSTGKLDAEIAKWSANKEDLVGALILQWKIFTQWTLDFQSLYPEWTYVLHDELCLAPEPTFERIFSDIQLEVTEPVRQKILEFTSGENVVDPSKHSQHMHKRASAELLESWKKRLEPEVIQRIYSETKDLWAEAVAKFGAIADVGQI